MVTNVDDSGSMPAEMGVRWGALLFDTTMQIINSCDDLEGRLKKKAPLLQKQFEVVLFGSSSSSCCHDEGPELGSC